jgi:hypothetical protein
MSNNLTKYFQDGDSQDTSHTLLLLGGAAIVAIGAGIILSSPGARRQLTNGVGTLLGAGIGKDIMRYMRMRAM